MKQLIYLISLIILSCHSPIKQTKEQNVSKISLDIKQEEGQKAPEISLDNKQYERKKAPKIHVDFNGANLKDVFKSIEKQSNLKFYYCPPIVDSVGEKVTMYTNNLTAIQVIELIQQFQPMLKFERKDSTFIISLKKQL